MKKNSIWLRVERYVQKPWYPEFLGLLAALDSFVVVIPTDGLLVTSVAAAPKRWLVLAFWTTLGSTVGAVILAILLQNYGHSVLEVLVPGIHNTHAWQITDRWVDEYGIWALFMVAALPFIQHPAIALVALAGVSIPKMAVVIFSGRLLKYLIFAYLSTHAPKLLTRIGVWPKD